MCDFFFSFLHWTIWDTTFHLNLFGVCLILLCFKFFPGSDPSSQIPPPAWENQKRSNTWLNRMEQAKNMGSLQQHRPFFSVCVKLPQAHSVEKQNKRIVIYLTQKRAQIYLSLPRSDTLCFAHCTSGNAIGMNSLFKNTWPSFMKLSFGMSKGRMTRHGGRDFF